MSSWVCQVGSLHGAPATPVTVGQREFFTSTAPATLTPGGQLWVSTVCPCCGPDPLRKASHLRPQGLPSGPLRGQLVSEGGYLPEQVLQMFLTSNNPAITWVLMLCPCVPAHLDLALLSCGCPRAEGQSQQGPQQTPAHRAPALLCPSSQGFCSW